MNFHRTIIRLNQRFHIMGRLAFLARFLGRIVPGNAGVLLRLKAYISSMYLKGKLPVDKVTSLVELSLGRADSLWKKGDTVDTARFLSAALQLYYHSSQVGGIGSPLLANTHYSDILRKSTAYCEIFQSKEGSRAIKNSAKLGADQKLSILALSRTENDFYFSLPQFAFLEKQGHHITKFALEDLPDSERLLSVKMAVDRGIKLYEGEKILPPAPLRPLIAQADIIWVEWGNEVAVLVSQWELNKPVKVHIHQYESKSNWLHLLNLPGIDHICYSAPSALSISLAQRPEIGDVPHSYIPLGIEVNRFTTNKLQTAQYTVAQIGWRAEVKDTSWTIEVMRRVHEHDSKWKLLIVGPKPNPDSVWARKIYGQIAQYDWIEITGNWDKVENYLPQVGYIISASVQEGLHLAVAEAACAGCVPVVRNWPELLHYGAASAVYPHEWIVNSPEEATRRILELTTPDEKYRRWVEDNFNATTTNHEKEQLLLSLVGAAHRPVEQE